MTPFLICSPFVTNWWLHVMNRPTHTISPHRDREDIVSKHRVSRKRRRVLNLATILGLSILVTRSEQLLPTTSALSTSTPRSQPPLSSSFSSHPLPQDTTTMGSGFSSLTVKELRELVKKSCNEKGLLSRLKKKQDLVSFLERQSPEKYGYNHAMSPAPSSRLNQERNGAFLRTPLAMPPPPPPPFAAEDCIESEKHTDTEVKATSATTTSASKFLSPKDVIFEEVYKRYPPLRDLPDPYYVSPEDDVRQQLHPIFRGNRTCSDMDISFVGTASCTPSVTRGVSCTALRLNWRRRELLWDPITGRMESSSNFQGGTWLFDVGECTQLQVQRSPSVRPQKITKIFLTHAHGDHTFGLPGLLCLMGRERDRETAPPVEIYGPEGLRMWLRVAIRYSVSRIVPPYRVHEIMDVPMAPEWEYNPRMRRYFHKGELNDEPWGTKGLAGEDNLSWIHQANMMQLEPSMLYGELDGGRSIFPIYNHPLSAHGAPVWEIEDEDDVVVYAAPMSHGIPCLGYVVEERPRPGRLRGDLVQPIVKRNFNALREAGFKDPMKALGVIKSLPPGSAFTFPDGTVVAQEEVVEPQQRGRKVVICGDTCDSRSLSVLAKDADVIIHEATNAYLQGVDKDTDLREVTRDAILHGHSTPQIAGRFCRSVNGQRLILHHFSSRYKGDVSIDSLSIMQRIEMQAMETADLPETHVAAAWDRMVFPVPR